MALQPLNQFTQAPVQGQLDLQSRMVTVSCQVSNNISSGATLAPGQAVKIDTANSGGIPKVLPLTANTDAADGFVIYDLKDQSFGVDARVEVAMFGEVMYMTSGAAISRNQRVEVNYSANTVIPAAGLNPVVGWAFDDATASGQLIRIFILTEAQSRQEVKTATIVATLAQINAGAVLLPGTAGKSIQVLDVTQLVSGAFATGTAVVLESTDASPVVVESTAVAALTNGAVVLKSTSGVTLGAGFAVKLNAGVGLQVAETGSAMTGGTSITFVITYGLA